MSKMRKSKLTNEQKDFIVKNYKTVSNRDICNILQIDMSSLHSYASGKKLYKDDEYKYTKHGIYKKILNKDYSYIYESMFKKIEPKIDDSKLYKSKYGKYLVNQNYFDIIDNEWKAYWLGFLYADGCVRMVSRGNKTEYVTKLTLCKSDIGHLDKFKTSLQTDNIIKSKTVNFNNKEYKSCNINICNQNICKKLNDLGCTPNKSLILEFPNEQMVSKDLIRHFIRGYFDGDGCVHINKKNKSTIINFVGTKNFLEKIQQIFNNELGLPYTKITQKQGQKSYQISYGGIEEFEKIFEYLYKDSNICLDRKLEKFKIIL